jgi:hypothetical protein
LKPSKLGIVLASNSLEKGKAKAVGQNTKEKVAWTKHQGSFISPTMLRLMAAKVAKNGK